MTDHLKIRNLLCRTQFLCDGVRTAFDFTFAIFEPEDIEVWIDGLAVTQGFAVQGVRETDGGRVVFQAPPAAGSHLTLQRRLVIARETDFQHGGILRADALNDELDRITAILQQLDGEASRAVRLHVSDDGGELRLPARASRAGQVLAFDPDGNLTTLAAQPSANAAAPDLDAIPEGVANKHFTLPEKQKLAGLSLAAGNASPPQVTPAQVTPAEKQAASETGVRSFSPLDIADMVRNNAVAGTVTSVFGRSGAIAAAAGDYRCDQIADAGGKVMMLAAERSKLARLRSVRDFGAMGDGIADDTAAINAGIAAMPAAGGRLYFPAGIYRVVGTVTLSKPGVYYGDGQATVIRAASAAADVFAVSSEQVIITDISWDSAVPRTGGAFVTVRASASRFRLQRFVMRSAFIGVHVEPGFIATATIAEGQILDGVPTAGIGVLLESGYDLSINDLLVGSTPLIAAGVRVTNTGDLTLDGVQLMRCDIGLQVVAEAGHAIASVWANNSFFDNNGSIGAELHAAGGSIVRCIFDQCWFASGAIGCRLRTSPGGVIDGVEFNGCHVFLNSADGINVADASVHNVSVRGGAFAQNSGSAFAVGPGVGSFSIIAARIGATHGLAGNRYGIFISSGASNNYIVAFNDLRGNTATALIDAGTGVNKVITANLGL